MKLSWKFPFCIILSSWWKIHRILKSWQVLGMCILKRFKWVLCEFTMVWYSVGSLKCSWPSLLNSAIFSMRRYLFIRANCKFQKEWPYRRLLWNSENSALNLFSRGNISGLRVEKIHYNCRKKISRHACRLKMVICDVSKVTNGNEQSYSTMYISQGTVISKPKIRRYERRRSWIDDICNLSQCIGYQFRERADEMKWRLRFAGCVDLSWNEQLKILKFCM